MTKAKKGLIITLFAAMMVFAFGATSVFASSVTEVSEWAPDYSWVKVKLDTGKTVTYDTNLNALRNSYSGGESVITATSNNRTWNGRIQASVDTSAYLPEELPDNIDTVTAKFYDLTGSAVKLNASYRQSKFQSLINTTTKAWNPAPAVTLTLPEYVENYAAASTKTYDWAAGSVEANGWSVTVENPTDYVVNSHEQQTITVTTVKELQGTGAYTIGVLGSVPSKEVTIAGKELTSSDAVFYVDSANSGIELTKNGNAWTNTSIPYTGAAHKIVMDDLEGFTVAYSVLNRTTGNYDPVSAIEVKDFASKNTLGKAVVTNSTDSTDKTEYTFTLNVAKATALFVMNQDGNDTPADSGYWKVPGSEYDAFDYVIATATTANDKKAVAADQDQLMAYFKEMYEMKTTSYAATPDNVIIEIKGKIEDTDAQKAVEKKYAALLNNYSSVGVAVDPGEVYLTLNATVLKRDHIYFTEAANVTYKVKKAKSLKKTKSFTVAAVADSGNAVTYKIDSPSKKITINSTTGKVTVKKGLKKGSYKVKVYAQTAGGNGYAAAYTYQPAQLTIKIKK